MNAISSEYIITNKKIYCISGVFGRIITETDFDNITDISFHQSVLGKRYNYGTILINTAGSNIKKIRLVGIENPNEVLLKIRRILDEKRKK